MNFSIEESKENDLIIKAATGNIKTRTIWNLLLTARPWAKHGSCFARCLFIFFVLSVSWPKLPLGHIVSGTSNHATYDVYSPKAVKTLVYLIFYEYSTLYLDQNMFLFCVIEALDTKRVLNT